MPFPEEKGAVTLGQKQKTARGRFAALENTGITDFYAFLRPENPFPPDFRLKKGRTASGICHSGIASGGLLHVAWIFLR